MPYQHRCPDQTANDADAYDRYLGQHADDPDDELEEDGLGREHYENLGREDY